MLHRPDLMAAPAWSSAKGKQQSASAIGVAACCISADDSSSQADFNSNKIASCSPISSTLTLVSLVMLLPPMPGFRLVNNMLPRLPVGIYVTTTCGSQSALSKIASQSCSRLESHRRTDSVDRSTPEAWALGLLAISCKLNSMVSALVASIQKMLQNLNIISGEHPLQVTFQKKTLNSPFGVFLHKFQTNLSLASSSQSVQEEVPSRTRLIPWAKVLAQFR